MEDTLEDNILIDRSRTGDKDAFGELVRRHRAKAFDWARSVVRDSYLAEDIVQEALLRAFLHLGTLADMDRFLPWLHTIVRNEALMKLRRGEHSGRERTLTELAGREEEGGTNWSDLDSVLHYMINLRIRYDDNADPAARMAQKEFLSTIRHMLQCLAPKERAVFEAHFFHDHSPSEIASLFQTTTDNVYQSLTRARYKVREERIRLRLQDYVRERKEDEVMEKAVLSLRKGPGSVEWKRCKTSFAGAIYALLPFTGRNFYTLTDVMGLTAQAFRLTVEEESIDATGPSMYFWESKFHDGLLNLGLESEHSGDGGAPPTPYMLNKGITHIRRSIVRGIPAIAWDLAVPEFGIIYGYDDAEQVLYADDAKGKKRIPYDRFGRGMSGGLFVLTVIEEKPVNEWEAVRQALSMAIRHAFGELTFVGYICGLAAYDSMMDALRRRRVDVLGLAYTLEVAADARAHGERFLQGLAVKLESAGRFESASIASDAARQYADTAQIFIQLTELFPFPMGGSPNDPTTADMAIDLIGRARSAEKAGVHLLERLSRSLS